MWDNVSLNNQEMGSKRTVKPEPEPPSSLLRYPPATFIRAPIATSEADIVALLAHIEK